jgi:hypothetical protein
MKKNLFACLLLLALLSLGSQQSLAQENPTPLQVKIQELYVGILGRAADWPGMVYWVDQINAGPFTLENTRAAFTDPAQSEYTEIYGGLTNSQLVTAIYENFLERAPELAGLQYWVGELDNGRVNADQMINAVINAVQDSNATGAQSVKDLSVLDNKIAAARYFTEKTKEYTFDVSVREAARAAVADVTDAPDSLTASKALTDSYTLPNNLTAVSLESDTPDPRIGYPLHLSLTIEAAEFVRDVGLEFFAFDKDQPETRQFSLGARTLEEVDKGSSVFEFVLDVPTEIESSGAYYVGVSVDTAETIVETNEDDNETFFEVTFSPKDRPNLFIEFMEPDRSAIVLDRTAWDYEAQISSNGEIVSDAGGTVTYGLKGAEQPIDVEAFATLRLIRSDEPGGSTGPLAPFAITQMGDHLEVPLYLWDSVADRYTYAYGIDPEQGFDMGAEEWLRIGRVGQVTSSSASEFDHMSAHLDYYFPGRLAEEIEIALRHLNVFLGPIEPPPDLSAADIQALRTFLFGADLEDVTSELCLGIRPTDASVIEDDIDDNHVCSPLQLLLPPVETSPPPPPIPPPVPPIYTVPSEPIYFDAHYSAGWPGRYFGATVEFNASSSADINGAVITASADIPVTLFGTTLQFLGINSIAQVLPLSDRFVSEEERARLNPGYEMSVSVLNQIIFVRNDPPEGSLGEVSISWSVETPTYLDFLPGPPDPSKPPPALVGENAKPPRPPFYASIGPIPVEFRPTITGEIGVEGSVVFGSPSLEALNFSVGPFASAEAVVEARATLVPFVRVEGAVLLLKVSQPRESIFSIEVLDDRHADGTSEVAFVNQFLVTNSIEGLSGRLTAALEVGGGRSCKKWGFFKFICKAIPTFRYAINLLSFEPFLKEEKVLRDERRAISIVTRPDGSQNYYQE